MPAFRNLVGQKFGRLTVTRLDRIANKRTFWFATCECHPSVEKSYWAGNLPNGRTRSCGCLSREIGAQRFKGSQINVTHGMSGTAPYQVWSDMKARCCNTKHACYADYGGRGIEVSREWQVSFTAFWRDMGQTYEPGLSLHRVGNDRGYSKENCVWTTAKVQSLAKRSTRIIDTPEGRMLLVDAAKHFGILVLTLRGRLNRRVPYDKLFLPAKLQRGGREKRR